MQASHSVFNFQKVSQEEKEEWKLFEYPKITSNWKQRHVLGVDDYAAEKKMELLNAKLGKKKQVKAFVAVFKNKSIKAAELQEQYFKGGNKNEFITCIGVDDHDNIQWVYIISWNMNKALNIKIRNWVKEQKKLNLNKLSDKLYQEIENSFERQPFAEFSYLRIDLTPIQMMWLWIVTVIISVGGAFWIVLNEFDNSDNINY